MWTASHSQVGGADTFGRGDCAGSTAACGPTAVHSHGMARWVWQQPY